MEKNQTILLTGAGAAIPWGAPSTPQITQKLISDKTFKSYTGQPIGDWLNHKLTGLYHKDPEIVNFETIINAIEYLITFYSSKNRESVSKYKNLMPAFFQEKEDLWELLWFDRIYNKDKGYWQSQNKWLQFYAFWNDYDYFFENVYRYFINLIIKQIEAYAIKAQDKTELNSSLNQFLKSIKNPLRCYTTNYDRVIPAVFNGEMFEGFTKNGDDLKFDLQRVLTDQTSNTYYNLHGSVHYEMDWPGSVKYAPEKFIYDFGRGASDKSDQDNRKLINSNIITGFNKPSRMMTTPHFQFYHRFQQDCLLADKIFIVGYSFSDFHINHAIKSASLANKELKLACISYMVYDEEIDFETEYDWVSLEGIGKNLIEEQFLYNIFEGVAHEANVDRILVYRKGFEKFLSNNQWERV